MKSKIDQFMQLNNLKRIVAFSGGSDDKGSKVEDIVMESIACLRDYPVAILTGGTSWGIPKIATGIAKDYGMKTIGVMPQRGEAKACSGLDLKLVIPPRYGGSEYGDESEVFAKLSDAVEIIGGSAGTAIEFFHIMKINDRKLDPKYGENPIIVAPVSGVKGFSSEISCLTFSDKLKAVLPAKPLYTGKQAADYIIDCLNFRE